MTKQLHHRRIVRKLKELPDVSVPDFARNAELLLATLKREDALAEELYISWEGRDGSQIVLSSLNHKAELTWFFRVKSLLSALNELLPPASGVCSALDLNKTKEMYVLLDILSANIKVTFQRLHI